MMDERAAWLTQGKGITPSLRWSFSTEAPLLALDLARETGEILAADISGGLYLLDRQGQFLHLNRGIRDVQLVHWSDHGKRGAAIYSDNNICCFDRDLNVIWAISFSVECLAIAMDSYGDYVAVSLASGKTILIDSQKKKVASFETMKPLSYLEFQMTEPRLMGAAENGLVCCYDLEGNCLWTEKHWSNCGGLAMSGDGQRIYLAGFNYGILIFDHEGDSAGTLVFEGTPKVLACDFQGNRIVTATIEQELYWLNQEGKLLWGGIIPDEAIEVACDPFGQWCVCGAKSGLVQCLDWSDSL
ncbi:WD40 repeat domain-containing protein [Gimesia benthica]|uniref:WD40 repeat domain-containing protein n=1 Tax=Gimesia benthica TaxID=2608982 RepID=A0A6I6A7A5_9PLAN|nr:WD40 repeat domain-containing protein [Gimesia benthica]QGQ21442.1 WD40 repeat domain-containing protein [Gimesia benthica]